MNRLTASILALGLAASVGTASAQSSGYYSQVGQPTVDRYGQTSGAYYDYARVVRVDPVIQSGYNSNGYNSGYNQNTGYGYPANGQQRCYTRQDTYAGNDGYYGNSYPNQYGGNQYGNTYGNTYGNQGYGTNTGRTMATVIGGVLGAVVGSKVGGGSARYATSALGSMVGGMAGRQVYENAQRNRVARTGTVQVCDPVQVGSSTYNSYAGGYNTNGYANSGVNAYDVTYEYAGRTYTTRTSYHPGDRIRVRVDVRPE